MVQTVVSLFSLRDFLTLDFGLHDLTHMYPNRVQTLFGTPAVIFRDHRWTLPVVFLAGKEGILNLPVRMVTFDRHRDSLVPIKGTGPLEAFRREAHDLKKLVGLVRDHLSPRDDDWIIAGMELGLLSYQYAFYKVTFINGKLVRDFT